MKTNINSIESSSKPLESLREELDMYLNKHRVNPTNISSMITIRLLIISLICHEIFGGKQWKHNFGKFFDDFCWSLLNLSEMFPHYTHEIANKQTPKFVTRNNYSLGAMKKFSKSFSGKCLHPSQNFLFYQQLPSTRNLSWFHLNSFCVCCMFCVGGCRRKARTVEWTYSARRSKHQTWKEENKQFTSEEKQKLTMTSAFFPAAQCNYIFHYFISVVLCYLKFQCNWIFLFSFTFPPRLSMSKWRACDFQSATSKHTSRQVFEKIMMCSRCLASLAKLTNLIYNSHFPRFNSFTNYRRTAECSHSRHSRIQNYSIKLFRTSRSEYLGLFCLTRAFPIQFHSFATE